MSARLLIVDDELAFRDTLAALIAEHYPDWAISKAASVAEALDIVVQEEPFDVVLTDMRMPADETDDAAAGNEGLAVIEAVRRKDLYSEIVVMTAYGSSGNVYKALEQGADQYVDKNLPDSANLILDTVSNRMRRVGDVRRMLRSVERWGQILYDRDIKAHVERENPGKYVALDLETGQYEVDEDSAVATERLLKKLPDAVIYVHQVGEEAPQQDRTLVGR